MAKRAILILGGARSGKSTFALRVAEDESGQKVYLATAQPLDEEMRRRIARHRKERSSAWRTVEEPLEVSDTLKTLGDKCDVVVIDCLTLWLANILAEGEVPEQEVLEQVRSFIETTRIVDCTVIMVSNEVGGGIVPENALARAFRDIVGRANQMLAEAAEEVFLVVAGVPVRLKPQPGGMSDA